MTKDPPAKEKFKIGERIDVTVEVKFPDQKSQLLMEIFTPDNETTIMMLCDVRISAVGNGIRNRVKILNTKIEQEAKTGKFWPVSKRVDPFTNGAGSRTTLAGTAQFVV